MFISQITRIYRGYDSDKIGMGKNHEKEMNEIERIEKAILNKIGDDEQLKALLLELQNATNELNYADIEDTFREAFILGAQIALEICGIRCEGD